MSAQFTNPNVIQTALSDATPVKSWRTPDAGELSVSATKLRNNTVTGVLKTTQSRRPLGVPRGFGMNGPMGEAAWGAAPTGPVRTLDERGIFTTRDTARFPFRIRHPSV